MGDSCGKKNSELKQKEIVGWRVSWINQQYEDDYLCNCCFLKESAHGDCQDALKAQDIQQLKIENCSNCGMLFNKLEQ